MQKRVVSINLSLLCSDDNSWRIKSGGQQIGAITYEVFEEETSLKVINTHLCEMASHITVSHFPIVVIRDICIDKNYRRRGKGTKALNDFTDEMCKKGVKVAMLRVGVDNFATRHGKKTAKWLSEWYEKLNFTPFMKNGVKIATENYQIALTDCRWCWFWKKLI